MKRTPLRRLSRLRRKTPLARRAEKATRNEAELRAARPLVERRSHGRCEATALDHHCTGWGVMLHHVLPRSAGGPNTAANLLHVCANGHAAIHAFPTTSYRLGLLARRGPGRPRW